MTNYDVITHPCNSFVSGFDSSSTESKALTFFRNLWSTGLLAGFIVTWNNGSKISFSRQGMNFHVSIWHRGVELTFVTILIGVKDEKDTGQNFLKVFNCADFSENIVDSRYLYDPSVWFQLFLNKWIVLYQGVFISHFFCDATVSIHVYSPHKKKSVRLCRRTMKMYLDTISMLFFVRAMPQLLSYTRLCHRKTNLIYFYAALQQKKVRTEKHLDTTQLWKFEKKFEVK